jgi:hypothetical protein
MTRLWDYSRERVAAWDEIPVRVILLGRSTTRDAMVTSFFFGERTTEEEVLANFALAEISSPKWDRNFRSILPEPLLRYLRETDFGEWTPAKRAAAIGAIRWHRAPFIGPLLATEPEWYEATVTAEGIGELRTPAKVGNEVLATDLTVDSIVRAIRAGRSGNATYVAELAELKRDFKIDLLRGKPILVATGPEEPLVVIEGTHRLPAIYWRRLESLPCPDRVSVLVGFSQRIRSWSFFPEI